MADQPGPLAQLHRLYVGAETRAAAACESLVGSNAFGELLAKSASNAMALARLANGGIDRGIGALRVAGRSDVADLARQLARTEDKLERMLQLVEELESRPVTSAVPPANAAPPAGAVRLANAAPPAGAVPLANAAHRVAAAHARGRAKAAARRRAS